MGSLLARGRLQSLDTRLSCLRTRPLRSSQTLSCGPAFCPPCLCSTYSLCLLGLLCRLGCFASVAAWSKTSVFTQSSRPVRLPPVSLLWLVMLFEVISAMWDRTRAVWKRNAARGCENV